MSTILFLVTIIFIIYSLITITHLLSKKNFKKVKAKLIWLFMWVGVYAILLIGISLRSNEHVLTLNENTCFDDWCVAVVDVSKKTYQNNLDDYYIKLRISSKAKRVSQKPDHPNIFLADSLGKHNEDFAAKSQFEKENGIQKPINSPVQPQSSYDTFLVFRTVHDATNKRLVINEGSFPVQLMIGDRESFLYKDTIFEIQ